MCVLLLGCFLSAANVPIDNTIHSFTAHHVGGGFDATDRFWYDSDGGHKFVRDQSGVLHAVFADTTNPNVSTHTDRLIYARSTDNGASWQKYTIDTRSGIRSLIWSPSLAVYGGQVYVVAATGQGEAINYNLTLFKFSATGTPAPSSVAVSTNSGNYFRFTDIVIDNSGMLNIAVTYGLSPSVIRFYRGVATGSSFPEETAVSAWTSPPQYPMYPALSVDAANNVYLAFEMFNDFNSAADTSAVIRVYKRSSGGSSWSSFATVSSGFRNRHASMINDSSNNLHLVYSKMTAKGGAMNLAYAVYNSAGALSYSNESIASALELYSPQIGLTTANIPVIQYVNRENTSASHEIRQVSRKSASAWSVPLKMAPDASRAFFLHMLPVVYDEMPHMLWFDDINTTVYFNRAPDRIAPYQPAAPSLLWVDKSLNSADTQGITVNTNAWTLRADHATPIQYDFAGARPVTDVDWSAYAANRAVASFGDRQTVSASIRARDAAGNISEWSPTISVSLADRTAPTRSAFSINADYVSGAGRDVSKNNILLAITAVDNVNGTAGQSGVNRMNIGATATLGTTASYSTSAAFALAPDDGLKTVYARFIDVSGNYNVVPYQATINVDTTPPVMPGTVSTNSSDRNNLNFTWGAATDPGSTPSGVSAYDIYWAQAVATPSGAIVPNKARQTGTTVTGLTCNLPSSSSGKYYLMVRAIDNVGNVGNWQAVFVYEYTGQPIYGDVFVQKRPKYQTAKKYTAVLSNDIILEYSAAAGSSISTANVRVINTNGNSASFAAVVNNDSAVTTLNGWALGSVAEGRVTVSVYYNGLVNSLAATTNTYSDAIILDRTNPGLATGETSPRPWTNIPAPGTYTWNPALDVTPSGVTEISGVDPLNYSYYWGTQNAAAEPSKITSNNPNTVIGLSCDTNIPGGSGTYILQARARDNAGNIGGWNTVLTYRYDNTTPNGTAAPNSSQVNNRNVLLTLTAADTHSGIAGVYIGESRPPDGSISWTAVTGGLSYTNSAYPYTLTSGDGLKTVYARYKDAAGNLSDWYQFTVDLREKNSGYTGSLKINDGAEWTNTQIVTLNFAYAPSVGAQMKVFNEDNSSILLYNGPAQPTINNYALTDADGVRKVSVLFYDGYGNEWGTYNAEIKLDRGAPYVPPGVNGIVINGGADYTYTTLNANLTIRATDVQSQQLEMRILNGDGSGDTGWISYSQGYYPWTLFADSVNNNTATVNIVFRDPAGNLSATYNDTIIVTGRPYIIIAESRGEYTNVTNNILTLVAPGAKAMQLSNDPGFQDATTSVWLNYSNLYPVWPLLPPNGEGLKHVYARFDYLGDQSDPQQIVTASDTIIYDITPPFVDPDRPIPPAQPDDPGYTQGSAWALINNGASYTYSELVDLRLSATDNYGQVYMYISNDPQDPNFAIPASYEPFAPTKSWVLLPGDGPKAVYTQFMDQAGNIYRAQDSIVLSTLGYYFRFIEPDGYNDVASGNFTISWEDAYPGDPNASVQLYYDTDRDINNGLSGNVTTNPALPVLISNDYNGVIWDCSGVPSGKYYIYAEVSGNYGPIRVYSQYPLYVVHDDGATVTKDPGTDPDWPGGGDTGTGPLPSDPPSILVLTPTLPDSLPNGGLFTIYYRYAHTPSADNTTYLTLWADTGNNPRDSSHRRLIAAGLEIPTASASGEDYYNWEITNVPEGNYYIYAQVSNNNYVRGDYSTGWVLIKGGNTPGNGGTGEPIWSFPNPFAPQTRDEEAHIAFTVDKDGWHRVYIYNVRGERVWQTNVYAYANRDNVVIWDGRLPRGNNYAGNGIYVLFLTDEKRKILGKGRLTLLD
jgi:hypothetical protein